jgi:hypothetical protein
MKNKITALMLLALLTPAYSEINVQPKPDSIIDVGGLKPPPAAPAAGPVAPAGPGAAPAAAPAAPAAAKPLSIIEVPIQFGLSAFKPTDPIATATYREYKIVSGKGEYSEEIWPVADTTGTNPKSANAKINDLLPNYSSSVVTYINSAEFGLKYLGASLSSKAGNYRVVLDFIKYRDEPIFDNNNKLLAHGRVGVGLRMIADLKTFKADLDLGSLIAIGANAKLNNLKGSLYVDVIGMSSSEISNLVPFTSVIDETSIQSALQALAAIKSKLYDTNTKLVPHIVAVNSTTPDSPATCDPGCKTCKKK